MKAREATIAIVITAAMIGLMTYSRDATADRGRGCECQELIRIRQILEGSAPPSVPPIATPTVPNGGELE